MRSSPAHPACRYDLVPRGPGTDTMITVTRLNGPAFALNPDLIERVEATPDTVIHLVGGNDYVVRESVEELIGRIRESRCAQSLLSLVIEQGTTGAPRVGVVPVG